MVCEFACGIKGGAGVEGAVVVEAVKYGAVITNVGCNRAVIEFAIKSG